MARDQILPRDLLYLLLSKTARIRQSIFDAEGQGVLPDV
jgi:hypothetical protein